MSKLTEELVALRRLAIEEESNVELYISNRAKEVYADAVSSLRYAARKNNDQAVVTISCKFPQRVADAVVAQLAAEEIRAVTNGLKIGEGPDHYYLELAVPRV